MNIPVKSEFLKIMIERGFVHQITDVQNLDLQTCKTQLSGYIGFDCTASSLHVGSLIQIMMLRWFQKTGNKPIIVMGGGTTKIGDPSGKDSARPVLSIEEIEENQVSIKSIFKKFLKFGNNTLEAPQYDLTDFRASIPKDIATVKHSEINKKTTETKVKTTNYLIFCGNRRRRHYRFCC